MRSSLPLMPSARAIRSPPTSSATPSAMLNQPSLRASFSEAPTTLGPAFSTLGSPGDRVTLVSFATTFMTVFLRLQYDLDAAVLLVAEHLVHFGSLLEPDGMGDDEGGVDLAIFD